MRILYTLTLEPQSGWPHRVSRTRDTNNPWKRSANKHSSLVTSCKDGLLPGRIRKARKLGCPWRMPYARPADPGWYRIFEYSSVDSDRGRRRLVVWVEASSPGPRRPRVPHEAWRGPFCNRWATGDVFSNLTGALYLGIGTKSRPGHAHGRPGGGQTRAYDRGSSGGSSHPPAHTRHGAGRAGRGCDSA